jgi:hypothetical protein
MGGTTVVQGQCPRGRGSVGPHRLVRTIKMADAKGERPVCQGPSREVGEPLQRADPGGQVGQLDPGVLLAREAPSEPTDAPSWAAWQAVAGFCPVSSCTLMATSNNANVLTATMKTISHLRGVGDGAGLTEGTGTPSRNSMHDCKRRPRIHFSLAGWHPKWSKGVR